MSNHLRALAILQIAYASLGLLLGLVVLLLFGGVAAIVGVSASLDSSLVAIPVLTIVGGLASSTIMLLSAPRLLAGIGLLRQRPWGRILSLVVCAVGLVDFPVGTGIGAYGLWVLTHREIAPMFDRMAAPAGSR